MPAGYSRNKRRSYSLGQEQSWQKPAQIKTNATNIMTIAIVKSLQIRHIDLQPRCLHQLPAPVATAN